MNIAQKVAINTSAQVGGQVVGVFVSLATLRVTTGYLGVHEFGELAIILAIGGLVVTISELGVTTTLARELAKTPDDADRLAGSLLRFRVLSSLALVLATLVLLPLFPYSTQTKIGLAVYLVGVLGQSLMTFPKAFFQTRLRLHLQAVVDLSTKVLSLAAVSVVAVLDLGFYALVAGLSVVGLAGFALAFRFLWGFWRPHLRWERVVGRHLVRDAFAIGLISIIGLLTFRGDAILLSLLAPPSDVGIYAVAYRFVDQAFVLPGLFVAAVFPIMARRVHEGPGLVDETVNRAFQVLALGSIAVATAIFTLSRPVVLLFAGAAFEGAVTAARILAFCVPFIFCAPVFYNLAIAVNKQRSLVVLGVVTLALNVALNLALIPPYSYNGAAAAAVVTNGVAFAGSLWIARRSVSFAFDTGFLVRAGGATLACVAAAAVCLSSSDVLAFVVAEAALAVAALATGAIRVGDLRVVLGRQQPSEET